MTASGNHPSSVAPLFQTGTVGDDQQSIRRTKTAMRKGASILAIMAATIATSRSEVSLPKLFSDHMVLQRSEKTPVWGKAAPGEKVRVQLGEVATETETAADGRWQTTLDLSRTETEPLVMTVEGANKVRIEDVLVGEVWLCAGQSNMEFPLSRAIGAEAETSKTSHPKLRQFLVRQNAPLQPADGCNGQWQLVDAVSAKSFSAVGYFFGVKLQETLHLPVGLIRAAVGSTPIEAWTSREGLGRDANLKTSAENMLRIARNLPQLKKEYAAAYQAWEKSSDRTDRLTGDLSAFVQPTSLADWKRVALPAAFSSMGLPDSGAVWLAKKIDIPAAIAGQPFVAALGMPAGWEAVYWNGTKIGAKTLHDYRGEGENRVYTIPADQVKAGTNLLSVRLFNAVGGMGVHGKPSVEGEWMAKVEFALPPLPEEERRKVPVAFHALPEQKKIATVLFNGMIQPLIPYAMKGVIWYQGGKQRGASVPISQGFPTLDSGLANALGPGGIPLLFLPTGQLPREKCRSRGK